MPPQTDKSAWEYVYDKYAPIMYGIALDMAGDTIIATEILKEAFLELKKKNHFHAFMPAFITAWFGTRTN